LKQGQQPGNPGSHRSTNRNKHFVGKVSIFV